MWCSRSTWRAGKPWPIRANTLVKIGGIDDVYSSFAFCTELIFIEGAGLPGPPGEDGICAQECAPQQQVSFFAGLSTNCNARGEAIPFDTVMTNQCQNCDGEAANGAYDGETGSFTAPVDGTYVFHVNVLLRILNYYTFKTD